MTTSHDVTVRGCTIPIIARRRLTALCFIGQNDNWLLKEVFEGLVLLFVPIGLVLLFLPPSPPHEVRGVPTGGGRISDRRGIRVARPFFSHMLKRANYRQ